MNFFKYHVNILYVFFLIFLAGCSTHQKITYKLDDINPVTFEFLRNYRLNIQPFEDIRRSNQESQILFSNKKESVVDGVRICINSENHYEPNTVSTQISQIIVKHFQKRNSFKEVYFNNNENADLYLTGRIEKLYGKRKYSHEAATTGAVGMQFGCLGGAISGAMISGMREPGEVNIIFSNLYVYTKDGNELRSIEDVDYKIEKYMKVDGYCWSIYHTVNDELKNAVDVLTEKVESAIISSIKKR